MKLEVVINGESGVLEFTHTGNGTVEFSLGQQSGTAAIVEVEPGVYNILWNGRAATAAIGLDGAVFTAGSLVSVEVTDPRDGSRGGNRREAAGQVKIKAPMPGKIVRVLVEAGQPVEAGQGVVVVEAMKMQNEMKAPKSGTVAAVKTSAGATVSAGDVLVILE